MSTLNSEQPTAYAHLLRSMTRDELHVKAKELGIVGFRKLAKDALIAAILDTGVPAPEAHPERQSLWSRYHNHFYGIVTVIGLVLTIAFFVIQNARHELLPSVPDRQVTSSGQQNGEKVVSTTEDQANAAIAADAGSFSPVTMEEFFKTMFNWDNTQIQRDDFLARQIGKRVIWEGNVGDASEFSGGVRLVLRSEAVPGRYAFFAFPPNYHGDLLELKRDQKVKVSGVLKEWSVTYVTLDASQLLKVWR